MGEAGGAMGTGERARLARTGLRLEYLTVGYNVVEAVIAITFGTIAGSIALVGFGFDSVIELTAGGMIDDPVPLVGVGAEAMERRIQLSERRRSEIDVGHDQRSQK